MQKRKRKGGPGWSSKVFLAVDWWALNAALAGKGEMYKQ